MHSAPEPAPLLRVHPFSHYNAPAKLIVHPFRPSQASAPHEVGRRFVPWGDRLSAEAQVSLQLCVQGEQLENMSSSEDSADGDVMGL